MASVPFAGHNSAMGTEPLHVRALVGDGDAQPKDVLDLAERHEATMVDLKFTDLPGTWQHMGMALRSLDEEAFSEGIGFDGSSIRGFQEIYESDMLLMPDPDQRHPRPVLRGADDLGRSARCSTRSRASPTRATRATWRPRPRTT